jgi:calmodulin
MKKNNASYKDQYQGLDLSSEEKMQLKEEFAKLDKSRQGTIGLQDLSTLLQNLIEYHNRDRIGQVQSWVEERMTNKRIDQELAMQSWCYLKELILKEEEDEIDVDILNTFVAMGGNSDKSGVVKKQKLVEIIKNQFGLTIDIEQMFEEAGIDTDGDLEFHDFACLLESGGSQRASRICSIFSQASY